MRLFVLLATFAMFCGLGFLLSPDNYLVLAGRLAMSVMLVFSAVSSYVYQEGILLTYPIFFSDVWKQKLILANADFKIALAAGFVLKDLAQISAIFIIAYFILSFSTDIKACKKNISIKRANYTGHGSWLILIKIPSQLIFIFWTYYFGLF